MAAIAFNLTRAARTIASVFHAKATAVTIRGQLIAVPGTSPGPPGDWPSAYPRTGPGRTAGRAVQHSLRATNPNNNLTTALSRPRARCLDYSRF